jgi:hypothetical protein
MSDSSKNTPTRRKFLSFGLLAGAGLMTSKVTAQIPIESGEKVKMLTQDGKLVEVDKAALPSSSDPKKATNKEVLTWIHKAE